MPKYIMLIGLPASGKSSWAAEFIARHSELNYQVVSSDDILEEMGRRDGLNYTASYDKFIRHAIREMEQRFARFVKEGANIIHDQTNVSVKTRKIHLAKVKGYEKSAIVFSPSEAEWRRRTEKRKDETGKDSPGYVIEGMKKAFELPTRKEGFVEIITIENHRHNASTA